MTQQDRTAEVTTMFFALQKMYDTHAPGWRHSELGSVLIDQLRRTDDQQRIFFAQVAVHDGYDYWFPGTRNQGRLLLAIVRMWTTLMHLHDTWASHFQPDKKAWEEWAADPNRGSPEIPPIYVHDHEGEAENIRMLVDTVNTHPAKEQTLTAALREVFEYIEDEGYLQHENLLTILYGAGFTFEDLYYGTLGQIALDTLRLQRGVLNGTYQRIWDGQDDEWHLLSVLKTANRSSETFQEDVYAALAARYPETAG